MKKGFFLSNLYYTIFRMMRRLFNIYPGEGRNALFFALLGFLWSLGASLSTKFSDALFLIHVGSEHLPTVYVICALGMMVPVIALMYVVNRIPAYHILFGILGAAALFYCSVLFCISHEIGTASGTIWWVNRIGSFQARALLVTGFWTFIDQYHNMQDAKRLFVLFTSSIFFGATVTGLIMRSGMFEFTTILAGIIFLMAGALLVSRKIVKSVHQAHDENALEEMGDEKGFSFASFFKELLKSPFSLLVMANNFTFFVLWVATEFNYLSAFDARFAPGPAVSYGEVEDARLTLFLGQLHAVVSFTNMIFGLFLYSRLVRRFGVGSLLFLSPLLLFFTFGGWLEYGWLLFPVIGYFVVEGTMEVIDDSNFNLLLNAIPKKLKYRVRIAIEAFLEPFGMLLTGLLLSLPFLNTKLFCLLLAAVAVSIAVIINRRYHRAIYRNLAAQSLHFERSLKEWIARMGGAEKRQEIKRLLGRLAEEEPETQILAAEALLAFEDRAIIKTLLAKAKQLSPSFKTAFLELLSQTPFSGKKSITDEVLSWKTGAQEKKVVGAIHLFLAKQGLLHPENVKEDLKSDDLALRSAAIIALKKTWVSLPNSVIAENRRLADRLIEALLNSPDKRELCMGLRIIGEEAAPGNFRRLLPFLENPSISVSREAIRAVAKISNKQHKRYAKTLIAYLRLSKDAVFRKSCLVAIGKLDEPPLIREIIASSLHFRPSERRLIEEIVRKMGRRSVPVLLALTKDTGMPERCRALAGRILGHLALSHLQANLHEIIEKEIKRAYFYYYHLHALHSEEEQTDLSLLREAMQTGLYSALDFIIEILGVAGEIEESDLITRLYRSSSARIRSQVIETLEQTCDRRIFRKLRPLLEDIPPSEVLKRYLESRHYSLPLPKLLEKMAGSPSLVDRIVAAAMAKQLDLAELKERVRGNEKILKELLQS